jgi:hypothetical protein
MRFGRVTIGSSVADGIVCEELSLLVAVHKSEK